MELIPPDALKKGMIIRYPADIDNPHARNWIVLPVAKKDLKNGYNADHDGLHAFGGLWYGRNPMKTRCYGKIDEIDHPVFLVRRGIHGMSVDDVKKLVN